MQLTKPVQSIKLKRKLTKELKKTGRVWKSKNHSNMWMQSRGSSSLQCDGFVENIHFQPGVKEWRMLRLTRMKRWADKCMKRWISKRLSDVDGEQLNLKRRWCISAERHDMLVPSTRTQLGRRSFHVAAPAVWNALRSSSINLEQFRAGLKTHLFTQAYGHLWELLLKSVLFYIYIYISK